MTRLLAAFSGLVFMAAACGPGIESGGPDISAAEPQTYITAESLRTTTPRSESGPTVRPEEAEASVTEFVDLYFVAEHGYATPVPTAVTATPDVALNSILALIAGPTPTQRAAGLSSSIPADTGLLDLSISGGTARIDLSGEFMVHGGEFSTLARLAQVLYTLTAFATIDAVEFWFDGISGTDFPVAGLDLDGPVDRDDLLAALPLIPTHNDATEIWAQSDLAQDAPTSEVRRIVLVADDHVLPARRAAGVDEAIVGSFTPGTVVGLTGSTTRIGSSTWVEVFTPGGAAWLDGHFLADVVSDSDFFDDGNLMGLINETNEIIATRGDLTSVTSSRGLYISYNHQPTLFSPDQLATVLTNREVYRWPSRSLDLEMPPEVAPPAERTFAEAIGDSFVQTWGDPEREYAIDLPLAGPDGRLSQDAVPSLLKGFHFISVRDVGDGADDPTDWTSWHISIDFENDRPVVVGLTIDQRAS